MILHKGPMDKDNGLGMSLGVGVGRDRGEQQGGKNWTIVTKQQ